MPAAAEFLREGPTAHSAQQCPNVAESGDQAGVRWALMHVVLQEGWVEVLGAVAERGERAHQQDEEEKDREIAKQDFEFNAGEHLCGSR